VTSDTCGEDGVCVLISSCGCIRLTVTGVCCANCELIRFLTGNGVAKLGSLLWGSSGPGPNDLLLFKVPGTANDSLFNVLSWICDRLCVMRLSVGIFSRSTGF
jgi:hypothetical protein